MCTIHKKRLNRILSKCSKQLLIYYITFAILNPRDNRIEKKLILKTTDIFGESL